MSRKQVIICAENMQKVYTGIEGYRAERDGNYPKQLTDLERYLYDINEIYCPMMLKRGIEREYIFTPDDEIILTCTAHKRGNVEIKNNGKIVIENLTIKSLRRWMKNEQ